jgi:thiosulfate/3-mercaptopyruvate sulfurtransferase
MAELVDGAWLAERLEDPSLQLLDPRPPVRYFSGHIRGAINVRADRLLEALKEQGAEAAASFLSEAGVSGEKVLLVYDDADGQLACTLAWILEYLGHGRVLILNERLASWMDRYGARALRPSRPPPGSFAPRVREELRVLLGEVLRRSSEIKLVDARSREEFLGQIELRGRGGRIPGAINIPWLEFLAKGRQLFLPPGQLAEKMRSLVPHGPLITYCSIGTRACVAFYGLKLAGYKDVRVYDGSFEEWASHPELPVEL